MMNEIRVSIRRKDGSGWLVGNGWIEMKRRLWRGFIDDGKKRTAVWSKTIARRLKMIILGNGREKENGTDFCWIGFRRFH